MRVGDQGDYEDFGDLNAAAEELAYHFRSGKARIVGWQKYGVSIEPGFTGYNYVSLFWGDDDAQPTRNLNQSDRRIFTSALKYALAEASSNPSRLRVSSRRKRKVAKPKGKVGKVHCGPRGGKYRIRKGRKVYI